MPMSTVGTDILNFIEFIQKECMRNSVKNLGETENCSIYTLVAIYRPEDVS